MRGIQFHRVQSHVPRLMHLCLNWQGLCCLGVVIPADEQHMVILFVGEPREQFVVVTFFTTLMRGVLERGPILALGSSQFCNVEVRPRYVRRERLTTAFLGVVFDQFTPGPGETMY